MTSSPFMEMVETNPRGWGWRSASDPATVGDETRLEIVGATDNPRAAANAANLNALDAMRAENRRIGQAFNPMSSGEGLTAGDKVNFLAGFFGPRARLTGDVLKKAVPFEPYKGQRMVEVPTRTAPIAAANWQGMPAAISEATRRGQPRLDQMLSSDMIKAYPQLGEIRLINERLGPDSAYAVHMRRADNKGPAHLKVDPDRLAQLTSEQIEAQFRRALQAGALDVEGIPRLNSPSRMPTNLSMNNARDLYRRLQWGREAGEAPSSLVGREQGTVNQAAAEAGSRLSTPELERRIANATAGSPPYNNTELRTWRKLNPGQADPVPLEIGSRGGEMVDRGTHETIRQARQPFIDRHIGEILQRESVMRDMRPGLRKEAPFASIKPDDIFIPPRY